MHLKYSQTIGTLQTRLSLITSSVATSDWDMDFILQGGVIRKRAAWRVKFKAWLLAIENPLVPGKEVSGGSYRIREVSPWLSVLPASDSLCLLRCMRDIDGARFPMADCKDVSASSMEPAIGYLGCPS